MNRTVISMLILMILISSSVLALERRGDIVGTGTMSDPYRIEDRTFGVLEDCSVVIYNSVLQLWGEDGAKVVSGTGTLSDSYRMADGGYGIVCVLGAYISNVFTGAPVQTGTTAAALTSTESEPESVSSPIGVEGCSTQRCNQIDEVWGLISSLLKNISANLKNKFWDQRKGWVSLAELHPGKSTPATTTINDVKQAAQFLLDSPNVQFLTGLTTGSDRRAVEDLASTGQTTVPETGRVVTPNLQMMRALVEMAQNGPIMINALTGGKHSSPNSNHYKGMAVDLEITVGNPVQIEAIANKYGGTRNSETGHIHLDFVTFAVTFTDYQFSSATVFSDTTYLSQIIAKSQEKGIDPCYPLVTVLFESRGNPNAFGIDGNIASCDVIARRKFVVNQMGGLCNAYIINGDSNFQKLRIDCNARVSNDCVDAVTDKSLTLAWITKDNICSGNYDPQYTYGIGLGQITPAEGTTSKMINGVVYSHCDLFNPDKNIAATVDLLKENLDQAKNDCGTDNGCIVKKTWEHYVGTEKPERETAFNVCQTKKMTS